MKLPEGSFLFMKFRKEGPLTFYVAGSFSQREEMRALMRRVEEEGHQISTDWTTHLSIKPYERNLDLAAEYAEEDIKAATTCDVFVLSPEEEGGSTQFAELGAAIVTPEVRRVFVTGPHNNRSLVFFHPRVERVGSIEEVFERVLPEKG